MSHSNTRKNATDLVGGMVGGMAQAVTGHPLETIKARLQAQGKQRVYSGAWHCCTDTVKNEGVRGLYRGLSPPLAMAGMLNAVIFGVNGFMKRLIHKDPTTPIPFAKVILAAEMTAPVYCAVLTPVEVLKVKLQVQTKGKELYKGPIDCVRKVVANEGITGMYRGFLATLSMRFVGLPFYFGTYEASKSVFKKLTETDALPWYLLLTAGGLGGIGFWSANYPLDLLKTRIQAAETSVALPTMIKTILAEEGVRGFYRGFGPCIVRAFPANAVAFCGWELTVRLINSFA
eukprot:TRINITY_DN11094_c0_g1_i1.p1 TRINITY_DN11094_c0_g1~~TRINITY_DN11094_c0_g1_i1.p1  ORF type:complete len:288 (-),score=23.18 TRINITY_DN11094_c0_g1_i1:8-871(-)